MVRLKCSPRDVYKSHFAWWRAQHAEIIKWTRLLKFELWASETVVIRDTCRRKTLYPSAKTSKSFFPDATHQSVHLPPFILAGPMARRFDDRRLGCNREINLYWILSNACFYSVLLASEVNQYETPSRAYEKKKKTKLVSVFVFWKGSSAAPWSALNQFHV